MKIPAEHLVCCDRRGHGWGDPKPFEEFWSPIRDGYVVITARGSLYFFSERQGDRGGPVRPGDGRDRPVTERFPGRRPGVPGLLEAIKSASWELSPTISPDARYLFYAVDGTIHQIDHATMFESVGLE